MTEDDVLALVAAARPLIAALVGVGGMFGLYAAANEGAIVQTVIVVITAGVPFGMMVWGYAARRRATMKDMATTRVAVAAATNAVAPDRLTHDMIAAVPDSAHAAAAAKVAALDANGGVPAAKTA